MSRRPLIAGNWKMNGSQNEADTLLSALIHGVNQDKSILQKADLAVFPPYLYLSQAQELLKSSGIHWGAQDVSEYPSGAYTGEISANMLADFACRYVIIGHSERRTLFGDTNERIVQKIKAALSVKLTPILCVGESLQQRKADHTFDVIREQLNAVFNAHGIAVFNDMVVAYEPVWAIGTGMTATPEQAQAVHLFIRHEIAQHDAKVGHKLRILYGGSVKPDNAAGLFAQPDIDGALVGGASLDATAFLTIAKAL